MAGEDETEKPGLLTREFFTRERIDSLRERFTNAGFRYLSHEEREANRREFLAKLPPNEDVWVFGYGSLMWNPAFHFAEQRPARLHGYHRRFCLNLKVGRGSPENPGLMLALDNGGSCHGIAYRIAPDKVNSETEILWMREMISGAYRPRWVTLHTHDNALRGLVFTINRENPRYIGRLPMEDIVERLATGEGELGSCRDYLLNTVAHLEEIGVRDAHLHDLAHRVKRKLADGRKSTRVA